MHIPPSQPIAWRRVASFHIAVCCIVVHCGAVSCSGLVSAKIASLTPPPTITTSDTGEMQHTATHCNTYCNTLQHTATQRFRSQRATLERCITFRIHCHFCWCFFFRCLRPFLVHVFLSKASAFFSYQPLPHRRGCASRTFCAAMHLRIASHCNTPHHTATLVRTATSAKHCNTLVNVRRGDCCTAPVEARHGFRCCVAFEGCTSRCNILAR